MARLRGKGITEGKSDGCPQERKVISWAFRVPAECQGDRTTRLLFVGKDADVRGGVCDRLRESGFEIFATADGPAGLSFAYENSLDMIVVDHAVLRLDARQLMSRLAQDARTADIPLLYLGERYDEGWARTCSALGITQVYGFWDALSRAEFADRTRDNEGNNRLSESLQKAPNFNGNGFRELGRVSSRPVEPPQSAGRSTTPRRYGPVPLEDETR